MLSPKHLACPVWCTHSQSCPASLLYENLNIFTSDTSNSASCLFLSTAGLTLLLCLAVVLLYPPVIMSSSFVMLSQNDRYAFWLVYLYNGETLETLSNWQAGYIYYKPQLLWTWLSPLADVEGWQVQKWQPAPVTQCESCWWSLTGQTGHCWRTEEGTGDWYVCYERDTETGSSKTGPHL